MISMEGWLFISAISALFLWGAIIGILGMRGGLTQDVKPAQKTPVHPVNDPLDEWGRDLWRTP